MRDFLIIYLAKPTHTQTLHHITPHKLSFHRQRHHSKPQTELFKSHSTYESLIQPKKKNKIKKETVKIYRGIITLSKYFHLSRRITVVEYQTPIKSKLFSYGFFGGDQNIGQLGEIKNTAYNI